MLGEEGKRNDWSVLRCDSWHCWILLVLFAHQVGRGMRGVKLVDTCGNLLHPGVMCAVVRHCLSARLGRTGVMWNGWRSGLCSVDS